MYFLEEYAQNISKKFLKQNLLLSFSVLGLCAFSILFIYSAGHKTPGLENNWIKQGVWFAIGGINALILMGIDYRKLGRFSLLIYFMGMMLLVLVLIVGMEINGAKSWLKVLPGVNLQPSELAKVCTIIPLAWYAAFEDVEFKKFSQLIPPAVLCIIPMALILKQPDMGSALVFAPIFITIIFLGGLKKRYFLIAIAALLTLGPLVYKYKFQKHQKNRVLNYVRPFANDSIYQAFKTFTVAGDPNFKDEKDVVVDDWNARQSELAVGSGGLYGKGLTQGTQNTLGFLPRRVAPTDFIFSVIAEESGFIGSTILLLGFCGLILGSFYIAASATDKFGMFLASSIGVMLTTHIFINIGMTIRVVPIIGIPLPFVSYGGSGVVLMMICIGILQSVYIHRNPER
ncbi:MAG: rod shape-determining protein RodA [Lentisphaeria bacterium]|nr:rod shape-determining protein RodA [Lentisphaeria bacterium]